MNGQLVGVLVTAAVAVVGPFLVYRVNKGTARTDAAQKQIDQIQEDREADRAQFSAELARMDERQARLEKRLELSDARERMFSDYVLALRWHIAEGKPPPPPPFPPELLRPFEGDR